MLQYRILEGLFFNREDREELREKIRTTRAGRSFVQALEKQLEAEDKKVYPAIQYDWYAYNEDIDHSTSVDNYQNFNGMGRIRNQQVGRAYLRTLAVELLDREEYKAGIREDMLRLAREYPLHLFVMVDLGLILYSFLTKFLFVLDAERALFSEEEQCMLDNFARGIAMDIIYEQEEWLRSRVGKQHCNNHMVAHSQAAVFAGLYYHRKDWVKYGLENPEGIYTYLEDGIIDGGMGIEASLTYNLMSIILMMETAEYLKRAGHEVDLYRKMNRRGDSLMSCFEKAMQFLTPDGRVVPVGDNYANITYLRDMPVFFRAYAEYADKIPGMYRIAGNADEDVVDLFRLRMGDVPEEKGEWPEAEDLVSDQFGLLIAKTKTGRDFWGSDGLTLAVRTGHGMIHGNSDHMAILLFQGGSYVLRDFEGKDNLSRHAFSGHITRTLNRSRLAHCAVMIDGRDSRYMNRETLKTTYETGEGWKKITLEDADRFLYPGVWQKRTLVLTEKGLEDVYEVECDADHDIDYVVHAGDPDYRPAFEKHEEILAAWYPGVWPGETIGWMRDAREVSAPGGIKLEYPGVKMDIRSEGAQKALLFTLPEADDLSAGGSHSVILRVTGQRAVFRAQYDFG